MFVIRPKNEAQQKALITILEGLDIPYDQEPEMDETIYLTSTENNRKRLDEALEADKKGEGVKVNIEDLWK